MKMKIILQTFSIIVFLSALGFTSCAENNSNTSSCFFAEASKSACEYSASESIVSGDISENQTLSGCVRMCGKVAVQNGVTLTIEAGTTILGSTSNNTRLIIERGGKINANGTSSNPIVFTSAKPVGERERGDWGGIVINGNSQYNKGSASDGKNAGSGEGESGTFGGGSNLADSSGTLQYVRIEFAGAQFTTENELNGLALQAVGSGTTIENVHLHNNQDDGIEMFGGTVNLKYIISTANGDDQMDWTSGWQGNAQFIILAPYGGDRGIEADNNSGATDRTPYSYPFIRNLTIISTGEQKEGQEGILLRVGTKANIQNAYIAGFEKCVEVDDNKDDNDTSATDVQTADNINEGSLNVSNVRFEACTNVTDTTSDVSIASDIWGLTDDSSDTITSLMASLLNFTTTNSSLANNSFVPTSALASDIPEANLNSSESNNNRAAGGAFTGSTFETADYYGAIENASNNWASWTEYPNN